MNLTEQQKQGQEVFFRIISEAWENDDFKKQLVANPEKTLEKIFGKNLSTGKKIKVTDQSDPDFIYINIPVKPQNGEVALDEGRQNRATSTIMTNYEGLYDSIQKKTRIRQQ